MGVKSIMIDETIEMEPSGRVLPIFRGEYDAGRTYENPDIVLYRNSSYVAKKITVGNPPPTDALADDYWQMVAKGIIDADVSDATVALTYESEEREALQSGETTDTLLSKIKRWYSDFATVVFSGKFSDLIDAPGIVSKTEDGLVPKGDGQANKVLKTDANGNPGWREDANTQSVTSVNNKTGVVTLTAADVKAIPTSDKIDKLNNIGQITRLGYWEISVIDNTYAASIGVDNNTGDFHALVLSYNGNGTNSFNFGTIILSSPRLGAYHYVIQVWEGTAHAERMLNFADVTNSTAVNITGKKALDAIEKNPSVAGTLANQLSQVNSNIGIHIKWCGLPNGNDANNAVNMGVYLTNTSTASCGDWGIILTLTNGDTTFNSWIFQVWLDTKGVIRKRRNINSEGWTTWVEI